MPCTKVEGDLARIMSRCTETPHFFGNGLFGVLHEPAKPESSSWVICYPFGAERTRVHRVCFDLARRMAAAGSWVLRFDYRGTGDSLESPSPATVEDYVDDLGNAVAHLNWTTGIECRGILGLRLGADLAAMYASRCENNLDLILWEPVVDGKRYRKMLVRAAIANEMAHMKGATGGSGDLLKRLENGESISVDGFKLTSDMYQSLLLVDPLATNVPYRSETLLVQTRSGSTSATRPSIATLFDRYSAESKCRVSLHVENILPPWIQSRAFQWGPGAVFDGMLEWMSNLEPRSPNTGKYCPIPALSQQSGVSSERPVGFAVEGYRVWGVIHEPPEGRSPVGRVVLLAAGEACRSAFFYTALARHLSEHGWVVLRFDPRGIGDSQGGETFDRLFDYYYAVEEGILLPEASAALDFLEREYGTGISVLMGLCGGALTSVLAAERDSRVSGVVPIELPMRLTPRSDLGWVSGMSGKVPWVEFLSRHRGTVFLLKVRLFLKALNGMLGRGRRWWGRHPVLAFSQRQGDRNRFRDCIGGDANVSSLAALSRVLERRIPVFCVFGDTEQPGLYEAAYPLLVSGIHSSSALINHHVVKGADHNFILSESSEELLGSIVEWLTEIEWSQHRRSANDRAP